MEWIKTAEQLPKLYDVRVDETKWMRSELLLGYYSQEEVKYFVMFYEEGIGEDGVEWEQWIVGSDEVEPPEQWTVIEGPE